MGISRPRRPPLEAARARRHQQHEQRHNHQDLQSSDRSSTTDVDIMSPSYLLSLDCLESLDEAFGGHGGGLDTTDVFAYADWPMDFSLNNSSTGHSSEVEEVASYQQQHDGGRRMLDGGGALSYSRLPPLAVTASIPREPQAAAATAAGICVDSSALRLIDNWFDEVCPAWSGFDSAINMNRRLAEDLWRESMAVFKSLQSMSASFLAARMPQMRRPALALLKTATHCIQAELEDLNHRNGAQTHLEVIPVGVLFALLCVGSSVCWLDARRAGWPFLQDAKRLLRRTLEQDGPISEGDAVVLDFFNKSLAHWEMMISFIYDPEPDKEGESVDVACPPRLPLPQHPNIDSGEAVFDLMLHPWTGVSSLSASLFARSMRISRLFRRRIAPQPPGTVNVWSAMSETQEAKRLEDQLLQLQFTSMPPTQETHDRRTPCLHLVYVAEAYQLASLLQLYISFPALVNFRLSQDPNQPVGRGVVPWYKWIIPLTLRLADVLECLPSDSGSRALHPMLYVCAATGLRYASARDEDHYEGAASRGTSLPPLRPMESILDYLSLLEDPVDGGEGRAGDGFAVPQLALDVSKARSLILRRLSILKEGLHPGPLRVAEELVRAIWSAYDEEPQGCTEVYWIDIMERKDLRTLFG
jgi:hypothetical protein